MKPFAPLLAASLLVPAALVDAQTQHDPLPVRVAVAHYGSVSTGPAVPVATVDLDLGNLQGPRIEVRGGWSQEAALLLVGVERAALPIAGGAVLHVDPATAVVLAGTFDQEGVFAVPFDPTLPALRGGKLCVQGVRVHAGPGEGALFLSDGMQLDFVPGNVQPQLDYVGPALTALPARELSGTDPVVRLRVDVAGALFGSALLVDGTKSTANGTTVELTLLEPAHNIGVGPGLFVAVELGVVLASKVDVVVRKATRGSSIVGPALLAARIEMY